MNQTNTQTNQTNINKNWLETEAKENENKNFDGEKLPSLKMAENKITEFEVDFTNPFQKWVGETAGGKSVTKKIIPVIHEGIKKNFWLNVKNPLFSEILKAGLRGQTKFKVLQTGTQLNTKYVLIKD